MANEEKTDKPEQFASDHRPEDRPEETGIDRPAAAEEWGEARDAAEPASAHGAETSDSGREDSVGSYGHDAFAAAPLRPEPVHSASAAESRDDTARHAEASPPPPARVAKGGGAGRGFVGGIVGSLLVLAAAGSAAYFTQDRWAPAVASMVAGHAQQGGASQAEERVRVTDSINTLKSETADVRSQFSSVGTRLQSLQQEIDTLKQQSEKIAASAAAANAAAAERPAQDITQPLEDINQRLAQAEIGSGRLSALEQRLADVQSALSNVQTAVDKSTEQAGRPTAAVLAINQLGEALGRSGGYAPELESVRAIAGGDSQMAPAIGTLEQWSRSGVPTLGEIRAEFPAMAQAVAQTHFQSEGDGWFDDVRNRLSALVAVRKVGDAALAGGGVDAALARADAALQSGDLEGAVKAIEGLEGAGAEAASAWLAKARDRLAANRALSDLRTAAIAKLNAARG